MTPAPVGSSDKPAPSLKPAARSAASQAPSGAAAPANGNHRPPQRAMQTNPPSSQPRGAASPKSRKRRLLNQDAASSGQEPKSSKTRAPRRNDSKSSQATDGSANPYAKPIGATRRRGRRNGNEPLVELPNDWTPRRLLEDLLKPQIYPKEKIEMLKRMGIEYIDESMNELDIDQIVNNMNKDGVNDAETNTTGITNDTTGITNDATGTKNATKETKNDTKKTKNDTKKAKNDTSTARRQLQRRLPSLESPEEGLSRRTRSPNKQEAQSVPRAILPLRRFPLARRPVAPYMTSNGSGRMIEWEMPQTSTSKAGNHSQPRSSGAGVEAILQTNSSVVKTNESNRSSPTEIIGQSYEANDSSQQVTGGQLPNGRNDEPNDHQPRVNVEPVVNKEVQQTRKKGDAIDDRYYARKTANVEPNNGNYPQQILSLQEADGRRYPENPSEDHGDNRHRAPQASSVDHLEDSHNSQLRTNVDLANVDHQSKLSASANRTTQDSPHLRASVAQSTLDHFQTRTRASEARPNHPQTREGATQAAPSHPSTKAGAIYSPQTRVHATQASPNQPWTRPNVSQTTQDFSQLRTNVTQVTPNHPQTRPSAIKAAQNFPGTSAYVDQAKRSSSQAKSVAATQVATTEESYSERLTPTPQLPPPQNSPRSRFEYPTESISLSATNGVADNIAGSQYPMNAKLPPPPPHTQYSLRQPPTTSHISLLLPPNSKSQLAPMVNLPMPYLGASDRGQVEAQLTHFSDVLSGIQAKDNMILGLMSQNVENQKSQWSDLIRTMSRYMENTQKQLDELREKVDMTQRQLTSMSQAPSVPVASSTPVVARPPEPVTELATEPDMALATRDDDQSIIPYVPTSTADLPDDYDKDDYDYHELTDSDSGMSMAERYSEQDLVYTIDDITRCVEEIKKNGQCPFPPTGRDSLSQTWIKHCMFICTWAGLHRLQDRRKILEGIISHMVKCRLGKRLCSFLFEVREVEDQVFVTNNNMVHSDDCQYQNKQKKIIRNKEPVKQIPREEFSMLYDSFKIKPVSPQKMCRDILKLFGFKVPLLLCMLIIREKTGSRKNRPKGDDDEDVESDESENESN